MSKTRSYVAPHESAKPKDTFVRIFDSMLTSPAFKHLSNSDKAVFVCMKNAFVGFRKPKHDFPQAGFSSDAFYFSLGDAERYGLYSRNSRKEFYHAIRRIAEHGFIRVVASGKANHQKSIYEFVDTWKKWKPPEEDD